MQGIKRSNQDILINNMKIKKSYEVNKLSLKSQPIDIENHVNVSVISTPKEQKVVKALSSKKTISSSKSIETKDIIDPVHTYEFFNVDENKKTDEEEIIELKKMIENERKLRLENELKIKELTKELNETKSSLNYYITLYDCAKITINDLEQKIKEQEEELMEYKDEKDLKEFMKELESNVKRQYDEDILPID